MPGQSSGSFDTLLDKLREEHLQEISFLQAQLQLLESKAGPEQDVSNKLLQTPDAVGMQGNDSVVGPLLERQTSPSPSLVSPKSPKSVTWPDQLADTSDNEPNGTTGSSEVQAEPARSYGKRGFLQKKASGSTLSLQTEATTKPDPYKSFKKRMSLSGDSKMLKTQVTHFLHLSNSKSFSKDLSKYGMSKLDRFTHLRGWVPTKGSEKKHEGIFHRIVNHQIFDALSACAIIANALLIGAVTNHAAGSHGLENTPEYFSIIDRFFTAWFVSELILRWLSEGFFHFFVSPHAGWNIFDCVVVGTDIIETAIGIATSGESNALGNLTVMRMLRVLRIARALRVVRLVHFCKELRMMVLSILRSGMALIWSMVLLGIIIYIFGIFLMQAATHHLLERVTEIESQGTFEGFAVDSQEYLLDRHFGSIGMACYTLFQAVAGGISWAEIGDPLLEVHWTNAFVMCFFVFFTIFAMLNIITGIFVETAINSVQNDKDEVIQEELRSDNSLIKQLAQIFHECDQDRIGKISLEQFETLLEGKRIYATLSAMGLKVSEARGMFCLLDSDHSGWVGIEDFLVGMMRLRGGAKSVDLITLLYENRSLMDTFSRFSKKAEKDLGEVKELENRVQNVLAGLLRSTQTRVTPETTCKKNFAVGNGELDTIEEESSVSNAFSSEDQGSNSPDVREECHEQDEVDKLREDSEQFLTESSEEPPMKPIPLAKGLPREIPEITSKRLDREGLYKEAHKVNMEEANQCADGKSVPTILQKAGGLCSGSRICESGPPPPIVRTVDR